ncbi:MAG: dynamin family protein [Candidatus Ozemobacteraceae bacterium]
MNENTSENTDENKKMSEKAAVPAERSPRTAGSDPVPANSPTPAAAPSSPDAEALAAPETSPYSEKPPVQPNNPQAQRFFDLSGKLKTLAGKLLLDVGDATIAIERAQRLPRVLIVGEFNAGKSSLINSGIGEMLLPTGVTPTTSLLTTVENGPFAVKVKPIGTREAIKIQPGKQEAAGYGIPDYIFDWEAFRKFLTDPRRIEKFERVDITHPAAPKEMVLIDSPGINDIAKSRAEIVYAVIPSADIVVFVLSAMKPFSESERTFLEEKLLVGDLKKILFVVNRLDEIDEPERDEVVAEVTRNLTAAVNKAYTRINEAMGQTLYFPVETVEVFPCSAKEVVPIHGEARNRQIGFATGGPVGGAAKLAEGNRRLWERILGMTDHDRQQENEQVYHHFLRRASLRISRTIETLESNRSSDRVAVFKHLSEDAATLGKLRQALELAESRILKAEESLKAQFRLQIEKVFSELISVNRLERDPGRINSRLKELYEYIIIRMKTTLDQLYADLGREFDSVIDGKQFFEERSLNLQYDFSNVPCKICNSMSYAYLAAIFFGGTVGIMVGAAYFASQVITNHRSVKQYFMSATVSEDSLLESKQRLILTVDREVEYAVDFVRQSLVQRVDTVQDDLRYQVFALQRPLSINLEEARTELDLLRTDVNGYLVQPAQ